MAAPQDTEAQLADLLKRSAWADRFHSEINAELLKLRDDPRPSSGLADHLDALIQKIHTRGDPWLPDIAGRAADLAHAQRRELLEQRATAMAKQHRLQQAEHAREMARLGNETKSAKAKLEADYQQRQSRRQLEHEARQRALQDEHEKAVASIQKQAQEAETSLRSRLQADHDRVITELRQKAEETEALLRSDLRAEQEQWEAAVNQKAEDDDAALRQELLKAHDREIKRLRDKASQANTLLEDKKKTLQAEHDRVVASLQEQAAGAKSSLEKEYQEKHTSLQAEHDGKVATLHRLQGGYTEKRDQLETQQNTLQQREAELEALANRLQEREDALQRDKDALREKESELTRKQGEHDLRCNALQLERTQLEDSKTQWHKHLDERLARQQQKAEHTLEGVSSVVQGIGGSVQSLETRLSAMVGGISDQVLSLDTSMTVTLESLTNLEQGCDGQSQRLGALEQEMAGVAATAHDVTGQLKGLEASLRETSHGISDVKLTMKTEFAGIGDAHGATQESIQAMSDRIEHSAAALTGLDTALGRSIGSIQDVAARVDTSVKKVGAGVEQMARTMGDTLGDIQTAQGTLLEDLGARLEASVAATGNLEAVLGSSLAYLASRIRRGQEKWKTYQRETSQRTTAIRRDLELAEEHHATRARDVVKHIDRAEASIQAVKADTEAASRVVTGLSSRFCTAEDSLRDLRDVAKHSTSSITKAWRAMVPVWEASARTLAELNIRSHRIHPMLDRLDGQSQAGRDDLETVKEALKDMAARIGEVRDKVAVLDEKSGTAELTVTVEKLHQNTLTMVKALVEARQAVEKTGDEVRAGSKARSAVESSVQGFIKNLSCKQDDLLAQLACHEKSQSLEKERDAATARIDVLTADVHRLTHELQIMREDGDLRAKITSLEQDLQGKEARLLELTAKHASEKRGMEDPETPDPKRRRGNDPSALVETPEWAAQVDDLVVLLHAMKARVQPGRVLRADMLMRETVWSLVQPAVSSHIRDFLTQDHPQDQWLCWTSVLQGGDGVDCACSAGERCIEVRKEGSVHVFRAETSKK